MYKSWTKKLAVRGFRRLAVIFIGYVAIFVVGSYAVWKLRTEELLTKKYDGGDLARMGYVSCVKEYRKRSDDLPLRHLEMKEFHGQPVDLLVIGDSFSNGGGEGRNSYYQDYIASLNNLTVLNVFPYKPAGDLYMGFNLVSTLAALYNSGYLDQIKPKCILLESSERYAIARFVTLFRLTASADIATLKATYEKQNMDLNYLPRVDFINEGNFNYLYYNFMYLFSDHAFRRLVYKKRLTEPLFSPGDGRTLIFHHDEMKNLAMATTENLRVMNENLNWLSDLLAKKGIKLAFMPIVDKSNLYRDFIVDNHMPQNTFFERFRELPRRYALIDTKKILAEQLVQRKKDLFYADDSHWSWRASEAIFTQVKFTDFCPASSSTDARRAAPEQMQ